MSDLVRASKWPRGRLSTMIAAMSMPRSLYGRKSVKKKDINIVPSHLAKESRLQFAMVTAAEWTRHGDTNPRDAIVEISEWFSEAGLWCVCRIAENIVGMASHAGLPSPSACYKIDRESNRKSRQQAAMEGRARGEKIDEKKRYSVKSAFVKTAKDAIAMASKKITGGFSGRTAAEIMRELTEEERALLCAEETVKREYTSSNHSAKARLRYYRFLSSLEAVKSIGAVLRLSIKFDVDLAHRFTTNSRSAYANAKAAESLQETVGISQLTADQIDDIVFDVYEDSLEEFSEITRNIIADACETFMDARTPMDEKDIEDLSDFAHAFPSGDISGPSAVDQAALAILGLAAGAAAVRVLRR